MIERLRSLPVRRGHPAPRVLSQYLDEDLDARERMEVEAHLRECPRCSRMLDSLARTVEELGAMRAGSTPGLVDSIVAALRSESLAEDGAGAHSRRSGSPLLTVVPRAAVPPAAHGVLGGHRNSTRAMVRYCLRRAQLRLTLPIAMLIGVALTFGIMLLEGQTDVGMCTLYGLNFLLPFVGLNIALLMATRLSRHERI